MKSLWLIFLFMWTPATGTGMAGSVARMAGSVTGMADSVKLLQSKLRDTKTAVLYYSKAGGASRGNEYQPENEYLRGSGVSRAGELQLQVVTRERSESFDLTAGNALLNNILVLKANLREGTGFDRAAAHQLYRQLLAPAASLLQGKTHLIIIPDSITGQIPFETLVPDTSSHRFLLHDYAVSYAVSLEALIRPGAPPSSYARQRVLAVAPFDVPSSEKEIMNIKADHVTGSAASLDGFKRKAGDYAVIHLATYAALDASRKAFIAFSPGTDKMKNTSRLFIQDLPQLNLNGVNLVVLSPCPTIPGSYVSMQALFNAAEAFASAGCPNFITSRWTAEKETTNKISMKLHQYIHRGYGYAYALQKARIDYLENPAVDPSMKSPAYWAGFMLVGELNTTPRSHKIFYYFALAFSVLIVACILRRKNRKDAECPEHTETIREPRSP